MDCGQARELLTALLDGELDSEGAAEVDTHLADCAACGAELRAAKELMRALGACPGPDTGGPLAGEVMLAAVLDELDSLRRRVADLESEIGAVRQMPASRGQSDPMPLPLFPFPRQSAPLGIV